MNICTDDIVTLQRYRPGTPGAVTTTYRVGLTEQDPDKGEVTLEHINELAREGWTVTSVTPGSGPLRGAVAGSLAADSHNRLAMYDGRTWRRYSYDGRVHDLTSAEQADMARMALVPYTLVENAAQQWENLGFGKRLDLRITHPQLGALLDALAVGCADG